MSDIHPEMHERWILKTELLWAFGVGIFIAATLSMILFTALAMSVNPPSNVERLDPKALHLSGEFSEHNLGTSVGSDGSVTVRAIATQFMFVPQCIAVPANRKVTFTSTGDLLMPCHEYCGLGHSEMWATVQVLPEDRFKPGPDGRVSCAQR
jgi:cytochrome c oxidase subunit 2